MRIPLSLLLFIIFSCCLLHSHLALGEAIEIQEEVDGGDGADAAVESVEEEASSSDDGGVVQYFYIDLPGGEGILEYEAPEGEWDEKSPGKPMISSNVEDTACKISIYDLISQNFRLCVSARKGSRNKDCGVLCTLVVGLDRFIRMIRKRWNSFLKAVLKTFFFP